MEKLRFENISVSYIFKTRCLRPFLKSFLLYSGLHLDEKTRDEVKSIKKEISDLGTTFGSNLNEDTTYLLFTEEELKGVPEDLIKSFEKVVEIILSI